MPAITANDEQQVRAADHQSANLGATGRGTGFVIHKNFVLTNRHVVVDDSLGRADVVHLSIPSGPRKTDEMRAEIVAVAGEHDLAILRCDELTLPAVPLSAELPRLGTEVMALGYPMADLLGKSLKVTRGSISALPEPGKADAALRRLAQCG